MKEIEKDLKRIIDLELERYHLNTVSDNLKKISNDLENKRKCYEDNILILEKEFSEFDSKINMAKEIKPEILVDSISKNRKKQFKIIIFFIILIILLSLLLELYIIFGFAILGLVIVIIVKIVSTDNRNSFLSKYGYEYEDKLNNFLVKARDLEKIYNQYKKDNLLEKKYDNYYRLKDKIVVFDIKYKLFLNYKKILISAIDDMQKIYFEEINKYYLENNVPDNCRNFLAVFKLYEYLKKGECDELEEAIKLYKSEFSFIMNDDNDTLLKLNDNKLKESYANRGLEFNKYLDNIKLIIDNIDDSSCKLASSICLFNETIFTSKVAKDAVSVKKDKLDTFVDKLLKSFIKK